MLRLATRADTVIAKRHFEAEGRQAEIVALHTLPANTRPELLARNDDVIVMSDLGDGPSLADLLLGSDRNAAERAFFGWASRPASGGGRTRPTPRNSRSRRRRVSRIGDASRRVLPIRDAAALARTPRRAHWTGSAEHAPAGSRQALMHRLHWLEHNEQLVPATAAFAHELATAISARYPSEPLPLFPAFKSAPEQSGATGPPGR